MRISDWSSDVCSSDLLILFIAGLFAAAEIALGFGPGHFIVRERAEPDAFLAFRPWLLVIVVCAALVAGVGRRGLIFAVVALFIAAATTGEWIVRSGEHTSELQSLMRISYAVFCLKKKKNTLNPRHI